MTFIHTHKSHVDNPWSVWDYRGPGGGGGGLYTIIVTTWHPLPTDQQGIDINTRHHNCNRIDKIAIKSLFLRCEVDNKIMLCKSLQGPSHCGDGDTSVVCRKEDR